MFVKHVQHIQHAWLLVLLLSLCTCECNRQLLSAFKRMEGMLCGVL